MKKIVPLRNINNVGFILWKDKEYPVVTEYENVYYCTIMGIKFGLDKAEEGELYTIKK